MNEFGGNFRKSGEKLIFYILHQMHHACNFHIFSEKKKKKAQVLSLGEISQKSRRNLNSEFTSSINTAEKVCDIRL